MEEEGFGWGSLLRSEAPRNASLKAALFTTYDRPDERLFVEHLLPVFLKLEHGPVDEGAQRQYFLLELDKCLADLHGKIVVISSISREEPRDSEWTETGAYGWVWRSVQHLTVGQTRRAIQHSKLWLSHWMTEDQDDYLEIVVSSTNLTRAAFKGQIQAGWRACLRLARNPSSKWLGTWGVLPIFLNELGISCGRAKSLDGFVDLLGRAKCPAGVTFVASVPGKHSRQALRRTPWGVAGLKRIAPVGKAKMEWGVTAPFVGSWSESALKRWCSELGSSPDRLHFVWIDDHHPWKTHWTITKPTLDVFLKSRVTLRRHRFESDDPDEVDPFHEQHNSKDERWSHAKLYVFRRGRSDCLVITSANFSQSALGIIGSDGSLTIENFELGVCLEGETWPFEGLEEFKKPERAATSNSPRVQEGSFIQWANATWDGKVVAIECRCTRKKELSGTVEGRGGTAHVGKWLKSGDRDLLHSRVRWVNVKSPPNIVELRCAGEIVRISVFDVRSVEARSRTLPDGVDPDLVQRIRDELLFEQYGGKLNFDLLDDERTEDDDAGDTANGDGLSRSDDDYTVPSIWRAREYWEVVKCWTAKLEALSVRSGGDTEWHSVLNDGRALQAAFTREGDREWKLEREGKRSPGCWIGARVAAQEMALRLKSAGKSR